MNTLGPSRIVRLVTRNGVRIEVDEVPGNTLPETPLQVSFEGLTPEEQEKALAAFPGGRRFILVQKAS